MAIKIAERHGRNFITIRVFGSLGYSFFALTVGYALRALGATWSLTLCIIIIIIALLITIGLKDVKKTVPELPNQKAVTTKPGKKEHGLKDILCEKKCCGSSDVSLYSHWAIE